EALRTIASTLKKTTWNFSLNPCEGVGGWRNPNPIEGSEDAVTCDCSFLNGTVCHVTSILLKTQDLQGSLPKELIDLPYLQEINLARNYLNGSIPPEWGALPLINITLLGNRLTGPIPKEFGNISTLRSLAVDSNQLSGTLPSELGSLSNLQRLFLNSNNFSGDIPTTFAKLTNLTDLRISDNRFYGLHINCGGEDVIINGTKYQADMYDRAPHYFESTINGWVSSNTANFIDDHRVPEGVTIWNNTSELKMIDPRLYGQARLSPVSFTYYAMCIVNGNYDVNLHFAEIMFSGNQTYKSLGRRIFDIYIQGKLMLKDFNIVEEANGVGKLVVKTFPVTITDGNLEIRLFSAGKGTVTIPDKGVYGPLISAISVDP
ncbi:unnamed protein product, partial [Thlaspi arvense]